VYDNTLGAAGLRDPGNLPSVDDSVEPARAEGATHWSCFHEKAMPTGERAIQDANPEAVSSLDRQLRVSSAALEDERHVEGAGAMGDS
jgi:hypothetical protein